MGVKKLMLGGCLIIAVMVVYIPSLHCGYIWDDDYYVTNNRALRGPGGLERIWTAPGATPQYYPMVFTSFWVEYQLFGLNPFVYHLNNILLHAANAVLLWLLLMQMGVPWAWFAAAVFALHPVQVESVTWISERKNVLSLLFGLTAMVVYCRFLMARANGRTGNVRTGSLYCMALLLFVGALLSKSVTVTIPVVILLLVWWKRGYLTWNDLLLMLPFFVVGLAAGLHTAAMEEGFVGAEGKFWDFSIIDRCLIAGRAVWFYIGKLVYPKTLVFIYPRWDINAGVWWQYLYPLTLIAVLGGLWAARQRFGRGCFTGFACYVVLLSPALGFVNFYPMKYSFVADHFQYHATTAIIALFAACARGGFLRQETAGRKIAVVVLSLMLLVVLGMRTWNEQGKYKDQKTLWLDTVAKNPTCFMAHNNLGSLLGGDDISDPDVYKHFQEAVKNSPCDVIAYYNMGIYHMAAGDMEKAVVYLKKGLACEPNTPRALEYLGRAYIQLGRMQAAIDTLLKLTSLVPSNPQGHFLLGRAFYQNREYEAAVKAFSNVLMLKPDYPGAAAQLAAARRSMHRVFEEVE